MNGLLTPLAILGIVLFCVAVLLVAIYLVQQAIGVVRLIRSARVELTVARASKPIDPPDELEEAKPAEPQADTPGGWGFDRPAG